MVWQRAPKFVDLGTTDGTLGPFHLNDFRDLCDSKLNFRYDIDSFVAAQFGYTDIFVVHFVQKLFDKMFKLGRRSSAISRALNAFNCSSLCACAASATVVRLFEGTADYRGCNTSFRQI